MKRKKSVSLGILLLNVLSILFIIACDEKKTNLTNPPIPDTELPTITITSPLNNSEFIEGSIITITAEANDNEEIAEVHFFIDYLTVFVDEEAPYEYVWNTGQGRDISHTIYAVAYDTSDNSATSELITVLVGPEFDWCYISAGDYTWGPDDEIQNIPYDYEIIKHEVSNAQYLVYLQDALNDGDIWIEDNEVVGYYEGDENYEDEDYTFYALGEINPTYNYARISWDGTTFNLNVPSGYVPEDFYSHPVVFVTYFGAWAYADYYFLRLPTEQEWEKAARGTTGFDYPWGDDIDGGRANYYNSGDPWDNGTSSIGYFNGENGTIDSPSPYGLYDLAGNVVEWTESWWEEGATHRVYRGGSWGLSPNYLQSWYRTSLDPFHCSDYIGFRCVRAME